MNSVHFVSLPVPTTVTSIEESPLYNTILWATVPIIKMLYLKENKRGDPSMHSASLRFNQDDILPWAVSIIIVYKNDSI